MLLFISALEARLDPIPAVLLEHSQSLTQARDAILTMTTASGRLEVCALIAVLVALGVLLVPALTKPASHDEWSTAIRKPKPVRRLFSWAVFALITGSIVLVAIDGLAEFLGTIALVNLFIAWLAIALTGLSLLFDQKRIPATSLLLAATLVFSWAGLNNDHLVRRTTLAEPRAMFDPAGPQLAFSTWIQSRADLKFFQDVHHPYPIFIVAARGGGLYAADQAATFLARMQDRCPNFSQHVFAVSAVSGGSLGAAAFSAYVRGHVSNQPWRPCQTGPLAPGPAKSS